MLYDDKNIKHIHCLGIGGIGVSALAEVLLKQRYCVTGSDVMPNQNTQRLQRLGVKIRFDHAGSEAAQADAVIYSSAISHDNPEYLAAQRAHVPIFKRGQILAEIMNDYYGIAVSGSHGKTTTSALFAHTLITAHLDPTFMIGGVLRDTPVQPMEKEEMQEENEQLTALDMRVNEGDKRIFNQVDRFPHESTPARLGLGPYCIGEADESDASLLFMHPHLIIITNVDADHLTQYAGNFRQLQEAYLKFLSQLPANGIAVVCLDDPMILELLPEFRSCLRNRHLVSYGFSKQADYRADRYRQERWQCDFDVYFPKTSSPLPITLNMPGKHNALNALAVVAACSAMDSIAVPRQDLQRAMLTFPGVDRRLGYHGEIAAFGGYAALIDDYGHHPNEIKATLSTIRKSWPGRRIVLVFQPHRYTRTRDLMSAFATVLIEADVLLLLDIYSAGEMPIAGVSTDALLQAISEKTEKLPIFVPSLAELPDYLCRILQAQDILILQGAGTIGDAVTTLIQKNE